MKQKKMISIGIPCFNEEENIFPVYKEIDNIAEKNKKYNFEFIFVNNGSTDKTKEKIIEITVKDKRVKGIFLSRNFGPEASLQAAIDHSTGDSFVILEADLQDPPHLINVFLKKWEEGFDIIVGIRTKIEDNIIMTFIRRSFYKIMKAISNIEVPTDAGSYGLIDRKVINVLHQLPEKYRFFRGLRAWVGFKTAYIKYERKKRLHGKSSYNLLAYIKHAERSFFGFSYFPLDIIIYLGLLLVLFSFIFILLYLLVSIFYGNPIKGSITILVSIFFFGGIQLLAISIIGKYIQVIVEETKERPTYIVENVTN